MKLEGDGTLLRIFVGEADKFEHKPVYEVIVLKARELGLAGATVLRGVEGFGAVSRTVHTAKILRLSEDLPMVIELVDTREKIDTFVGVVEQIFTTARCGGMMTLEKVNIIKYTPGT